MNWPILTIILTGITVIALSVSVFQVALRNLARVFVIYLPFHIRLFASGSYLSLYNEKNKDLLLELLDELTKRARKSKVPQISSIELNDHGSIRLYEVHYVYYWGIATICLTDVTDIEILQNRFTKHVEAEYKVFQTLHTGIIIFDNQQKLIFCNAAQERIWGLDNIIGMSIAELLHTLKQHKILPTSLEIDDFIATELGMFERLTEAKTQIFYMPDNKVIRRVSTPYIDGGILQSSEDITEFTHLEKDMTHLLSIYRNTLNNIQEGVAVLDARGNLQLWNPAFAAIWHLNEDFLNSGPHHKILLDKVFHLVNTHIKQKNFAHRIINILKRRRGIETRVHFKSGAVVRVAALPVGKKNLLLLCRDITLQQHQHPHKSILAVAS